MRPYVERQSPRLVRLWWIGVLLKVCGWHRRQHERICAYCERQLRDMGVIP